MNKASEAAALAGWSSNPNVPIDQRLAAADQALDFFVGQWDKLRELLAYCEQKDRLSASADRPTWGLGHSGGYPPGQSVYGDVAERLRAILDGE